MRDAAEAIKESGRIEIITSTARIIEVRTLSHDVQLPGKYLRVEVSDTGRGTTPHVLERTFQPFFTSRPGGTGLGLRASFLLADLSARSVAPPRGRGESVLAVCANREQLRQNEEVLAAPGFEPLGVVDLKAAAVSAARAKCKAILLHVGAVPYVDFVRSRRAVVAGVPLILLTSCDSASELAGLVATGVVAALRRELRSKSVADPLSSYQVFVEGTL